MEHALLARDENAMPSSIFPAFGKPSMPSSQTLVSPSSMSIRSVSILSLSNLCPLPLPPLSPP